MNKAEYKAQKSEGRLIERLVNTPAAGMVYEADCVVSDGAVPEYSGPDHIHSIRHCAKQIISMMSVSELEKIFNVTVNDPREYYTRLSASRAHGYEAPPLLFSLEEERKMIELYENRLIEFKVRLELSEEAHQSRPSYVRLYDPKHSKPPNNKAQL